MLLATRQFAASAARPTLAQPWRYIGKCEATQFGWRKFAEIGSQPRDAAEMTPFENGVDHGDLRRHGRGMRVRQVDGGAAEADARGRGGQAGDEDQARGDRLAEIGDMLADERFDETELFGEQDRGTILAQGRRVVALLGMERHGEEAELHRCFPQISRAAAVAAAIVASMTASSCAAERNQAPRSSAR